MVKDTENNKKHWSLRTFNNLLSVLVLAVSVYMVTLPLLPNVTYKVKQAVHNQLPLVRANTPGAQASDVAVSIPKQNILVVPSINMQSVIYDGANTSTLSKGAWRRPLTSNPEKGSNTVLVGHRYTYSGAGVFYHLDKIRLKDTIVVYWAGSKHTYTVSSIQTVSPQEGSVEAETLVPTLTLYTCAPLFSFTDRLVITAHEDAR